MQLFLHFVSWFVRFLLSANCVIFIVWLYVSDGCKIVFVYC